MQCIVLGFDDPFHPPDGQRPLRRCGCNPKRYKYPDDAAHQFAHDQPLSPLRDRIVFALPHFRGPPAWRCGEIVSLSGPSVLVSGLILAETPGMLVDPTLA